MHYEPKRLAESAEQFFIGENASVIFGPHGITVHNPDPKDPGLPANFFARAEADHLHLHIDCGKSEAKTHAKKRSSRECSGCSQGALAADRAPFGPSLRIREQAPYGLRGPVNADFGGHV